MKFLTQIPEATRAWMYRVATAGMALAVVYGLISVEEAPLWLGLLVAVLGVGAPALASANTTRKPES